MEPQRWEPADVTFPDYKGNVALDFKMTGPDQFAVAGIEESKWQVVGFDWTRGESMDTLHVLAIDRSLYPKNQSDIFPYLMEKYGHIPVTDLQLHDVDPNTFLKSITHMFHMQLRARGLADYEVFVTKLDDVPIQD